MKQEFRVVDHYIPRRESMEKATGQIAYTDDMNLPDQAYAIVIRSPYSSARVLSIDMPEAEKFPGYLGCLLPDEVPQTMYNPSGNPPAELLLKDVVLLTKEAKFIGDRLLCVAVETAEACREAARRVKIDFEVKKSLVNVRESMAEGAEQIEPHLTNNNIVRHRQVAQGDTSPPRASTICTSSSLPCWSCASKMTEKRTHPTGCVLFLCCFSRYRRLISLAKVSAVRPRAASVL